MYASVGEEESTRQKSNDGTNNWVNSLYLHKEIQMMVLQDLYNTFLMILEDWGGGWYLALLLNVLDWTLKRLNIKVCHIRKVGIFLIPCRQMNY